MTKIAPSILSADFAVLGSEIASICSADYLHFDVMDGVFVPNLSIGIPVLESVRKVTDMTLDVHLMIDRPVRYVKRFADAGADIVVFHLEADEPQNTLEAIRIVKECGKKVGLALKPKTPASALIPYLSRLDMALVMTVEPGFGGQVFMENQMEKVTAVRKMITDAGLVCDVEVDGGINRKTAPVCVKAGANVLAAGSSVFGEKDRAAAIRELRG